MKFIAFCIFACILSLSLLADSAEFILSASDGSESDAYLGWSVGVSGNRAVVGAYRDNDSQGAMYVYHQEDNGDFVETQKLQASDGADTSDQFGIAVATSGVRIVAGAPYDMTQSYGTGAAYVFVESSVDNRNFTQSLKLLAYDASSSDRFGGSIASSGLLVAIGAVGAGNAAYAGAMYVFWESSLHQGDFEGNQIKLKLAEGSQNDKFADHGIAVYDHRAFAGAHEYDLNETDPNYNAGAVFIYSASDSSTGDFAYVTMLYAEDHSEDADFGYSLSAYDTRLAVGAVGCTDWGSSSGAVYMYAESSLNSNDWTLSDRLISSDGAGAEYFGISVSVHADLLVVGADEANYETSTGAVSGDQGKVVVFLHDGEHYNEEVILRASDGTSFDYFGNSVAVDGELIVAGAYGAAGYDGQAYVYTIDACFYVACEETEWCEDGVCLSDAAPTSSSSSEGTSTSSEPIMMCDSEAIFHCAISSGVNWYYHSSSDAYWASSWSTFGYGEYRSFFLRSGDYQDYYSLDQDYYDDCEWAEYFAGILDCYNLYNCDSDSDLGAAYEYFDWVVESFDDSGCYNDNTNINDAYSILPAKAMLAFCVVLVAMLT